MASSLLLLLLLLCVSVIQFASAFSFSSSSLCLPQPPSFLYNLQSQCPISIPSNPPLQVPRFSDFVLIFRVLRLFAVCVFVNCWILFRGLDCLIFNLAAKYFVSIFRGVLSSRIFKFLCERGRGIL